MTGGDIDFWGTSFEISAYTASGYFGTMRYETHAAGASQQSRGATLEEED